MHFQTIYASPHQNKSSFLSCQCETFFQFLPGKYSLSFLWTDSFWQGVPSTWVIWITSRQESSVDGTDRRRKGERGRDGLLCYLQLTHVLKRRINDTVTVKDAQMLSAWNMHTHIHLVWYPPVLVHVKGRVNWIFPVTDWIFLTVTENVKAVSLTDQKTNNNLP